MIKVFLSAVFRGLELERSQLIEQLESTGLYEVIAMERFGAGSRPPLDVCLSRLREADVVVLVIGPRYGSLVPAQGISYTHAEYRHALDRRIDVIPFVLPDQQSLAGDESERLRAFVCEVGSRHTYQGTTGTHLIRDVQRSLTGARQRGEIGRRAGPFQKLERFFERELRVERSPILHHTGEFVGRRDELERVAEFLHSDCAAMIVRGAGGLGKSRLILEAVRRMDRDRGESPSVLFMRGEASFNRDDIDFLPTTRLVLCIDDAHRMGDLENLLRTCRDHNRSVRVLCTCRSSATDILSASLTRGLDPVGDIRFMDVEPMDRAEALEFARHELGDAFAAIAEELVRVADANPLVIRVGAACIAKHLVSPHVLANSPSEFRALALDQLLNDPAVAAADRPHREALLSLLSAIGPVQPSDALVERMAEFVESRPDAVRHALDALELAGFVRRRRNTVRVTPDVLADHMLQKQAITGARRSSGYIDRVVASFGADHLGNILLNSAELDWRNQDAGDRVLEATWLHLRDRMRSGSTSERYAYLKMLDRPAAFMPFEVLALVEICLEQTGRGAPGPGRELEVVSNEDLILGSCIDLLGLLATHPDLMPRCLAHLARIAGEDNDIPPRTRKAARDRIKRLMKFSRWQLERIQGQAAPWLITKVNSITHATDAVWMIEALAEVLRREIDISDSDGKTVSWGFAPIFAYYEAMRPTRQMAIESLIAIGVTNPAHRTAGAAIGALASLLRRPTGSMGRVVEDRETAVWASEALGVLTQLLRAAGSAASPIARQLARDAVLKYADGPWIANAPTAEEITREIKRLPRDPLWECLCGRVPRRSLRDGGRRTFQEALLKRASGELAGSGRTPEELSDTLEGIHNDGSWLPGFYQFGSLLRQTLFARTGDVIAVAEGILAKHDLGDRYGTNIVIGLWDGGFNKEAQQLAMDMASAEREARRAASPYAVAALADLDLAFSEVAWEVLSGLAQDPSPQVRAQVARATWSSNRFDAAKIASLLVSIAWDDCGIVGEAVLDAIQMLKHGGLHSLSPDTGTKLLEHMARAPSLELRGHAVEPVLELLLRSVPTETLRMLVGRVKRPQLGSQRQTLPHLRDLGLGGWTDTDTAIECLRVVRDAFLECDARDYWDLSRLFTSLRWENQAVVRVLEEWLKSLDEFRAVAMSSIIDALEHDFVYDEHAFVARLLEAAAAAGSEALQDIESALVRCGSGGGRTKSAAEPVFPRDEQDRQRATALVDQYQSKPHARALYTTLARLAESSMERSRRDFDDEDGD